MLTTNKIYQTEILSCVDSGDGICRIDGMVVFVKGACEGDVCEIRVDKVKSGYAQAHLVRVVSPSEFRVSPPCPVYERCGGCQLMHIRYEKQLAAKKQTVIDALSRIGHLDLSDVTVYDTLGMEAPNRYRNKMVFPIGTHGKTICGGFYAPKSHDIVALSDCLLGERFASDCLARTLEYMKQYRVSAYNEKTHTGLVRRLFVRTGYHSREAMAVLSVNGSKLPNERALVDFLLDAPQEQYRLTSIVLNENREKNNLVLGEKNRVLYGKASVSDSLCGISFDISPNSFFQVNPIQTERLYQTAIDFAELTGRETVLDLYCGIGTISLCTAARAKRVFGAEIVPQAIENAKQNALRNRISNVEFYNGDAQDISEALLRKGLAPDVIFTDPPRKGCDEKTLENMIAMHPKQIVYISCNPATLARDLRILSANGYLLVKVQPVDMFPQTTHVECVVLLSKKDK